MVKKPVRIGVLNGAFPPKMDTTGNYTMFDAYLIGALQQATLCDDPTEQNFIICKSYLYALKEGNEHQAQKLVSPVRDVGMSCGFQYRSTKAHTTDSKLVKFIQTLAAISRHAKEGVYFEATHEFKAYLISQFNMFPSVGVLKSESYEFFALVSNANWILMMFQFDIFDKSSCRTEMFEILDALSPFTIKKRRLYSGGTTSNYYYRHYILFYLILMWMYPDKRPPAQGKLDITLLRPMSKAFMMTRLWAKDTIESRYHGNFMGI